MPVSPISPVSAIPSSNQIDAYGNSNGNGNGNGNGSFGDPWARDRDQRSQLRAQTSAAAQQASIIHNPSRQGSGSGSGGPGNDKLRNVVGAFMSASKRQEELPVRRPGRSEAREKAKKERKEEIWDVGTGDGGNFAEIDCTWSFLKTLALDCLGFIGLTLLNSRAQEDTV